MFQDWVSVGSQVSRAARQDWGMEIQEPARRGWVLRGWSVVGAAHHCQTLPSMS